MKNPAFSFLISLFVLTSGLQFSPPSAAQSIDMRVARPAIVLNMTSSLVAGDSNREAIAEASQSPGIYRGFLVWRQRYAHLAICNTYLCHGTCIEFGDGCLVSAHSPVLPVLMESMGERGARGDTSTCSGEGVSRCH